MLDKSEFRSSEDLANWPLCPYDSVFEIQDSLRKDAIEQLQDALPKECFSVSSEKMVYHGTTKQCVDDYCFQLSLHASDVKLNGFSQSVLTPWQALNTLYFIDDMFFIGRNLTNLLTLPQLLSYLEQAGYGETTFLFGSITLVED